MNDLLGSIVNAVAIIVGGVIGTMFGRAFSEKVKTTLIQGIALAVLLIGFKMALQTNNALIVIGSLVIGGLIGEWIDIEYRLNQIGLWLEKKFSKGNNESSFTKAFVTTSLIYCVGAMAIMGALESGLKGTYDILFAKAVLDGVSAVVFASSMGIGVLVSAIPVLIYQGSITLSASLIQGILSDAVINEMSAVGGLLIVGIGISILEIKQIKVGNLLPGIFLAIPLTLLMAYLHLG